MASISFLTQFPCKILQVKSQYTKPTSTISSFPLNSTNLTAKSKELIVTKSKFHVRVVSDDEWGPDKKPAPAPAPAPAASGVAVAVEEPPTEVELLKKKLVDSFNGTDRGLSASSEARAKIVELITRLESLNPTPAPTEALTLLDGKWILAYTSFSGLFPLLSRGTLPQLIQVEEISQTIDSETLSVQNSVVLSGPLSKTSVSTNAKYEVRSPKSVQVKFEEGIIGTPQLIDSIVFPDNLEILGQTIDLSPFKGLITSLQDTASSVAKSISSQPPLKFPIANSNITESWLLTTYLDNELRISRGDGGSVFVLIKEGSHLMTP